MKSLKALSALAFMSLNSSAALAGSAPDVATLLQSSGFELSGAGAASFHQSASDAKNYFQVDQLLVSMSYQSEDGFAGGVDIATGEDVAALGGNVAAGNNGTAVSLNQAYMRYKSGPYMVMAGRFYTAAGYEVFPVTGNLFVTRSGTFKDEPTYHTGVRGSYALNQGLTLNAGILNGSYQSADSSLPDATFNTLRNKTFELGATWVPVTDVSLALTNYRSAVNREIYSFVATYKVTDQLSIALNADKTHASDATNVAFYTTYAVSDKIKAGLRLEELNPSGDNNNTGTIAAVVSYTLSDLIDVRAELSDSDKQGAGNPRNIAGALQTVFKF